MSISLGSTNFGSVYLGSTKIGSAYLGNVKVFPSTPSDPYNPLNLPSHTIRCKFAAGYTPDMGDSHTLVDASENIWDIYRSSNDWNYLLSRSVPLSVIGANTTGVTGMSYMFHGCGSLTSVPLFDTSSVTTMSNMFDNCRSLTSVPRFDTSYVTDMSYMFYGCDSLISVPLFETSSAIYMYSMFESCNSLTSVPLFDTSSVTHINNMFKYCKAVESGALALYQQASTQATPPTNHNNTFYYCGRDTVTGAAELAQIPYSWGGTRS